MNKCHLHMFQFHPKQEPSKSRVLSRWLENQVEVTEKARSGTLGWAWDMMDTSGAWGCGSLCVNK